MWNWNEDGGAKLTNLLPYKLGLLGEAGLSFPTGF